MPGEPVPIRTTPSPFELLITCNPPILESLLNQVPTETIYRLYQTSPFLRDFFSKSPTSWRYISWRLYQAAATNTTVTTNGSGAGTRQSSNYALDQIILTVINPFSTRLVSLELDNTAVSGTTLTSTVLILRRETLLHLSVRGCKNVSLKYHINPWLQMHALARESAEAGGPPGFETLALKSLYTYRCRHHRRRPYLPSSLARKESDSEPTHELVLTCHKLGIWTDTAWCTTPGARCYRRRGYVKLRLPQDTREVWVVYDRLWRSRNWLGSTDQSKNPGNALAKKRKRDCRSWEFDEEALNGEPIGTGQEGKAMPAHLRQSHRKFVENISCQNCSAEILERCEQCSVMMHCIGCRKTLCASCAFDRPYLRNKNAPEEDRNKFWWAPGCAVSPCSMQDQDFPPAGTVIGNQTTNTNTLPNIKFRWCCTEPLFSGGGGMTFGGSSGRDTDCIRAAPLPPGQGWEDPEFSPDRSDVELAESTEGPGGRWASVDRLFQAMGSLSTGENPTVTVPRVLCDECYSSEHWKLKCKACSTAICLKHDVADRLKARICGYKDLMLEKQEFRSKQKALKLLASLMRQRKERGTSGKAQTGQSGEGESTPSQSSVRPVPIGRGDTFQSPLPSPSETPENSFHDAASLNAEVGHLLRTLRAPLTESDPPRRPLSPTSDSTGPLSRSTSPTPSANSVTATPEPSNTSARGARRLEPLAPTWRGCQAFFCPATRTTQGDHRRRCVAIMKQCLECGIHVCGDCVNTLEPPCPCKGCRPRQPEDESGGPGNAANQSNAVAPENALFFCPNCRWNRMVTGRCKRKSEAFLNAQSRSLKKLKKRKDKVRKPLEDRRMSQGSGSVSTTEEAIDGLVEFFTSLNTQFPGIGNPQDTTVPRAEFGTQQDNANQHDIQELEDMGALARDLIRRIQRLRDQFRPGSLAALALPDIRVEDEEETRRMANALGNDNDQPVPLAALIQHAVPIEVDDEDEEEHLDERESSTE